MLYGARAFNLHLPPKLEFETFDWDFLVVIAFDFCHDHTHSVARWPRPSSSTTRMWIKCSIRSGDPLEARDLFQNPTVSSYRGLHPAST